MPLPPNVILIVADQFRGDCLGVLGHPVAETPHLDMMARDGVLFTSAYSAVPSCVPARVALFTGLSQERHGRVGYEDGIPWDYRPMLAGAFAEAGYHTQCVGKMHVHPARALCGFHNVVLHDGRLGFSRRRSLAASEHWDATDDYLPWLREHAGTSADITDAGLDANSWVARPWPYAEELHPTSWVVTQCIDFLRRRDPSRPFFLMCSFVRPHAPLDPPAAFLERYPVDRIPPPPVGDWAEPDDARRDGLLVYAFRGLIGERALERARAAYYGLITQIDFQVGRLLLALEDHELFRRTIVVFLSDHGELLGDHHLFRKYLPYRGSALIPFVVYDPGGLLAGRRASTVDSVVELRDVMPSLLDFAGIPIPEGLDGASVLPLLEGRRPAWREYIHGEHALEPAGALRPMSNQFLVSSREKYIWFSQTGREQYFDLANDPLELHDLASDPRRADRLRHWRSVLARELKDREEGYSDGEHLVGGREPRLMLQHRR